MPFYLEGKVDPNGALVVRREHIVNVPDRELLEEREREREIRREREKEKEKERDCVRSG